MLIDHAYPLPLQKRYFFFEVRGLERNMVHALAPLFEELGEKAVRSDRLQQFDREALEIKNHKAKSATPFNTFKHKLCPEYSLKKCPGLFDATHGNADVIQPAQWWAVLCHGSSCTPAALGEGVACLGR